MPFRIIDGARIFYRTYGVRSSSPSIILIHGATVDGATDWAAIAPLLGLTHHVIVPDCRGHGRSENPAREYSFARLARDVAGLVTGLGVGRAHIVGHSNGGNVALVTLMNHPDVVASCVIQAANAFVSPDLREHEPHNFDPERVDREDPEWREEMIRLHARWHGRNYWRDLLGMTLKEIVSAPDYGVDDLAAVDRPVLVIEGQNDRVNARSNHGAFIASGIPSAELWRPAGVGHTVHAERPAEWITRLEDFWQRRGSTARDHVWRLASGEGLRDRRTTVFEVQVTGEASHERAEGAVLREAEREDARETLADTGATEAITVLEAGARPGRVVAGVADILAEPVAEGERLTQGLFGEDVSLLDVSGDFVRVQLAADGYIGWVKRAVVAAADESRHPDRSVCASVATAHAAPDGPLVGRLPLGSRLAAIEETEDWLAVRVYSERVWWLRKAHTRPLLLPSTASDSLSRFQSLIGTPYLWGGRSTWGFDCSGLSQAFYHDRGIELPRDADQQWIAGEVVVGEPAPGDLLFFANPGGDATRPTHVAIALVRTQFLHAWGASGSVTVSDLDPGSDDFAEKLAPALLGLRRFAEPASVAR